MLFYHDSKVRHDSFEDCVYVRAYQRNDLEWVHASAYGWYRHICVSQTELNLLQCSSKEDVEEVLALPNNTFRPRNIQKDPWHIALNQALAVHGFHGVRYKTEIYVNSALLQVVDVVRVPCESCDY